MKGNARFALVPLESLRIHEEINPADMDRLLERIRHDGRIEEPILVSSEGNVILNGHHRYRALQELGARRAPVWVVDYHAEEIVLDRWNRGPPISKDEVLERARQGRPFPPKTTRHHVHLDLPHRATPLAELFANEPG